ncbi:hypothetical protein GEV33_012397 [Tenebrio molitor]|uniref:Uncharacterized protein n=1 Tax=Tenebrio molitor TaxID=7067 RepID=A0A8J6L7B1_TENMO|nr:hypothetical protein GEV33_012397 [Tenebrio molitor]
MPQFLSDQIVLQQSSPFGQCTLGNGLLLNWSAERIATFWTTCGSASLRPIGVKPATENRPYLPNALTQDPIKRSQTATDKLRLELIQRLEWFALRNRRRRGCHLGLLAQPFRKPRLGVEARVWCAGCRRYHGTQRVSFSFMGENANFIICISRKSGAILLNGGRTRNWSRRPVRETKPKRYQISRAADQCSVRRRWERTLSAFRDPAHVCPDLYDDSKAVGEEERVLCPVLASKSPSAADFRGDNFTSIVLKSSSPGVSGLGRKVAIFRFLSIVRAISVESEYPLIKFETMRFLHLTARSDTATVWSTEIQEEVRERAILSLSVLQNPYSAQSQSRLLKDLTCILT